MRRRILSRLLLCVIPPAMFVGCATTARVGEYVSPSLREMTSARIVVVPFGGPSGAQQGRSLLTKRIALELQSVLPADVIVAPEQDEQLAAESALWLRGRINVEALVAAQKRYLADAFVFGTLTQYKEYDPPVVGLKVRMLSARTGEVLWAADGLFDAYDKRTRKRAVRFFKNSGMSESLYGPDLVFMSPNLYSMFVAAEVVQPLREMLKADGK